MLEKHFQSQQYYTQEFYNACLNGDFELAVCLLKLGVNLNVKFEHGQNLLHIACMKNFYGLVQLLIKFGCNEFLKDNMGRNSLHYAALNNSTSIVRYLVEKNTFSSNNSSDFVTKQFLNCQDIDGKTAVHLASENNYKEPIMIILSSGLADINLEDNNKQNALALSYKKKNWEVFELLVKSGSNISKYLLKDVCVQGDLIALNILLRYFDSKSLSSMIDLNELEDKKNSFLYLSIKYSSNLEFINKLFDIGLKTNSKDLKDFYGEFKQMTKTTKQIDLNKFNFYLECFILLIKFNCFNSNLISYSNILRIFNMFELKNDINFDQKSNILNHIVILYLNLIYDHYTSIITKIDTKQSQDDALVQNIKTKILYLFALAVYSSQLNIKKKFVLKWFNKKFLTQSETETETDSNSTNKKICEIFKESLNGPWSLQMLCRCKIKADLKNIDYVLNDKNLIKSLKLPNICVRYLKYEFI